MTLTIFSFLPIVLLIGLMVKRHPLPSSRALPLTALVTYGIMLMVFARDPNEIHAQVVGGLLTAWTPILIIWGAIFLFRTLEATGGMAVLRQSLDSVTPNPVAQLMILGWAFTFLIEGASGFGTPAALATPVLVGLGFAPLRVAVMVLIMDTVPVSFGAVGTPTWFGFSSIELSPAEILTIGTKTALIHGVAALVIPLLALSFVVSWRDIRRNLGFIYLSILCTVIPYGMVARFSCEFPALVGGAIGLVASIALAKLGWGLQRDHDTNTHTLPQHEIPSMRQLVRAAFPLWGTLLVLVITRIPQLGLKNWLSLTEPAAHLSLGSLGQLSVSPSLVLTLSDIFGTSVTWSHMLLYVPSLLPFGLVALIACAWARMRPGDVKAVFRQSLHQIKSPTQALLGTLVFVNLMMMGDDTSAVARIGQTLADWTGSGWTAMAAYLGAIGSFFSGSNTISNLTFAPIQDSIARDLGLNRTTVLALQSVGGAMGNMICLNVIVAVSSVLNLQHREGYILARTVPVLLLYGLIAAGVALLMT